jgi:ubiquinone/menaquinone biosynthesis C-methylase UbiE
MDLNSLNPKERFSDLADVYERYRPDYPEEILGILQKDQNLKTSSIVADIGSGTGKLARLFLSNGNKVYAVEPNDQMRALGEALFSANPDFISIKGQAESTSLGTRSVDFIVCGTAFHWFEKNPAKTEFKRIAKPGGKVMLVWNRRNNAREMMQQYDLILQKFCPEYERIGRERFSKKEICDFFEPHSVSEYNIGHFQEFDFDGFLGRIRSTSYCPRENSPEYASLIPELESLFAHYELNGKVRFDYITVMFVARTMM